MSQYSTWENTKGITATPYNYHTTLPQPSRNLYCVIKLEGGHMQFRAIVSGISVTRHHTQGRGLYKTGTVTGKVRGPARKTTLFSGHYLRNRSTLDIGVLGHIGIV